MDHQTLAYQHPDPVADGVAGDAEGLREGDLRQAFALGQTTVGDHRPNLLRGLIDRRTALDLAVYCESLWHVGGTLAESFAVVGLRPIVSTDGSPHAFEGLDKPITRELVSSNPTICGFGRGWSRRRHCAQQARQAEEVGSEGTRREVGDHRHARRGRGLRSSACGGGASSESSSSGTLKAALSSEPAPLDPDTYYEAIGLPLMTAMYEGLVTYAPNSPKIEPQLATSWNISPDGKTYEFSLREGSAIQRRKQLRRCCRTGQLPTADRSGRRAVLHARSGQVDGNEGQRHLHCPPRTSRRPVYGLSGFAIRPGHDEPQSRQRT